MVAKSLGNYFRGNKMVRGKREEGEGGYDH